MSDSTDMDIAVAQAIGHLALDRDAFLVTAELVTRDSPASLAEIAKRMFADPQVIRDAVEKGCRLGLVVQKGKAFAATAIAAEVFRSLDIALKDVVAPETPTEAQLGIRIREWEANVGTNNGEITTRFHSAVVHLEEEASSISTGITGSSRESERVVSAGETRLNATRTHTYL